MLQPLQCEGGFPVDNRFVFNTLSAMLAYNRNKIYDGLICYCKENGKTYQYNQTQQSFIEIGPSYTKTQTDTLLNAKVDKNQGAENAGKVLVVGNDGNVEVGDTQSSGGKIYLPGQEIFNRNGTLYAEWLCKKRGLIAKFVADVIDISGCTALKDEMRTDLNTETAENITKGTQSAICTDDRTWQLNAKFHRTNNPFGIYGKKRWTGDKTLYAWRKTSISADAPATIPNNQFNLPLVITPNPQPGEARIMVQPDFAPSASATLAFRIEADGQKQRQIMEQAPGVHIDVVPANGALQFDLNGTRIYGPLFDDVNCSYYVDNYYFNVPECPVVADLQDIVAGYCYNSTDSKYYYRATAQDAWSDITSTINFVADLPTVSQSIVGNLYVANDNIGQDNSIQIASWGYSQENIANSSIASFRFADFYQTACPRQTTAPDPADYQYYYEPNGNKYYHYNGSAWEDITSSIILKSSLPSGQNWPSSYNNEDYFVDDTPAQQGDDNPRWGQDNSLYVAKVYSLTSSNIDVFTIANSLDIQLSAMNVLVKDVSVLATYTASNQNWLIKIVTTTGGYQVGTYNGTESDAPLYVQDILDSVARQVLGDVYTFTTSNSSTVSVYDEQGTWISHDSNLADKYATISGTSMTYNNASYTRDAQHDTNASNYMRVGTMHRLQIGYSDMGATTRQSLPDATGDYKRVGGTNAITLGGMAASGVFRALTKSTNESLSSATAGTNERPQGFSFALSNANGNYVVDAPVNTSDTIVGAWFVLKKFDLNEEMRLRREYYRSV